MKLDCHKRSLLGSLGLLTFLFCFMQLALVVTNVLLSAGVDNFQHNSLFKDIFTSHHVLVPLLQWFVYQLLIYSFFIAAIWLAAVMCGELFRLKHTGVQILGLMLWCLAVAGVLIANNAFYPHSVFSKFTEKYWWGHALTHHEYMAWLNPIVLCVAVLLVLVTIQLIISILRRTTKAHHQILVVLLVVGLVVELVVSYQPAPAQWQAATKAKPNIIIVGLDALRPDFAADSRETPNITRFLSSSMNFTHAYTVIAQTLPAWVSVLTAAGPKINLARENLVDLTRVNAKDSLATRLQQQGYATLFATDDSRFNLINQQFGFDQLIIPRSGVAEFILGEFNDFPLSNLLVRSSAGRWLFPYNYANHESSATYDPDNFIALLERRLSQPDQKPLFLAVHFNLSGWPFGWYNSQRAKEGVWYYRYAESVRAVDQQFGDFMQVLQRHHLLENTLVVLMSDHGVTLGLPLDRAITEKQYLGDTAKLARMDKTEFLSGVGLPAQKTLATSYGYGGDLLSPPQAHVLLAFKTYDLAWPQGQNNAISALTDIAPTILDYLHMPFLANQEGVSLLPFIQGKVEGMRDLYFETSSSSFLGYPTEPALNTSLQSFVASYAYNKKTDAIYLQPEAAQNILRNKQRGVLSGNWILVELPESGRFRATKTATGFDMAYLQGDFYMVLLNIATGQWTTDLTNSWAARAPMQELCSKLTGYYGAELQCKTCCAPWLTQKSETTSSA